MSRARPDRNWTPTLRVLRQGRACRRGRSPAGALFFRGLIALLPTLLPLRSAWSAEQPARGVDFFVGAGALYDDNLFRQPSGPQLTPGIPNLHRDDVAERLSAGFQGTWTLAQQSFELKAQGDDNRFEHNDQLNNVSANAKASWDWQFGSRWSGRVGADYSRLMADFANNLILEKDLLTQRGTFAGANYLLGTRWVLSADVRWASTTHSAEIRRVENDDVRTQKFGIEFRLSPTDSIGWNYQHSNANFATDEFVAALVNGNYHESSSLFWLKYALGGKTDLKVEGGYLRRDFANAAVGSYSGGTARATLNWHPGAKTQIALTGWRDLTAYIDAESNYFVTTGARVAPSWAPTERINTSLAASWERQKYIGSDPSFFEDPQRRDMVRSVQANAMYLPRQALELDLTFRREQRGSTRSGLTYVDNLALLGVRVTF